MNHRFLRRALPALLLCIALLATALVGCSESPDLGTTIMTLEGQSVSENMVQLLMARMKGNLQLRGYTVSSDAFWNQITELDGTNYDTYIRNVALRTMQEYLAASVMFEEQGYTLSQAELDKIEEDIDEMINDLGSKSSLNADLAQFGANVDILRALYVLKAKYASLQDKLYGADGSLITSEVKQQYLNENAIAFRRLLIRSSRYVYEKDANGDVIYYRENNEAKVNAIAYDTVKGQTRIKDGKTVTDANGDAIYYTETGRIAYDTVNGKPAYVMDKDGNPTSEACSEAELEQNSKLAKELLSEIQAGGAAAFESILLEYEGQENRYTADTDLCFVYRTDNNAQELGDIADALLEKKDEVGVVSETKPGDVVLLETDQGIYILMRYEVPTDAATNSTYTMWFTELGERIANQMYQNTLSPYVGRVVTDEAVVATLPSMKDVQINTRY